ncbi:MAG: hypothetical protein FJX76_18315 [Armatimonadetes bacterium]|nr:hypothetical protein [Armatimonadota bacterium]
MTAERDGKKVALGLATIPRPGVLDRAALHAATGTFPPVHDADQGPGTDWFHPSSELLESVSHDGDCGPLLAAIHAYLRKRGRHEVGPQSLLEDAVLEMQEGDAQARRAEEVEQEVRRDPVGAMPEPEPDEPGQETEPLDTEGRFSAPDRRDGCVDEARVMRTEHSVERAEANVLRERESLLRLEARMDAVDAEIPAVERQLSSICSLAERLRSRAAALQDTPGTAGRLEEAARALDGEADVLRERRDGLRELYCETRDERDRWLARLEADDAQLDRRRKHLLRDKSVLARRREEDRWVWRQVALARLSNQG